jgi:hypothetical protein
MNKIFDFLPGLFNMLCDKTKDVNQSADKCLKDFLFELENVFEKFEDETTNKILEIIIDQCKTMPDSAKLIAFDWLLKFLKKYNTLLNTISLKNIRYQNKYYKKLVNSKESFSNNIQLNKSLNFNENKNEKKIFNKSFNDNMDDYNYLKSKCLYGFNNEQKSTLIEKSSCQINASSGKSNTENDLSNFDRTNPIDERNENDPQISFINKEKIRHSAMVICKDQREIGILF